MTLLGSWTVLLLGKKWESREEDRAIFRFKQLTAGLALGAIAYALSNYLMVPWDAVSGPNSFISKAALDADIHIEFEDKFNHNARHWNGFYDKSGIPLFPPSSPTLLSSSEACVGGDRPILRANPI